MKEDELNLSNRKEGIEMSIFDRFFHNPQINDDEIQYTTVPTLDLTDDEIQECSDLFGTFYGRYNADSPIRPQEQIKMPTRIYKENYCKPNFYVALAKHKDKLIGHAFYLRKQYDGYGMMTWVLQLVVDQNYRKRGIASTLLRSIWGFSDDYAWGLATTNPCTIKTLESATFRKFKPTMVRKHMKAIRLIQEDISFAKGQDIYASNSTIQLNSHFFVDNREFIKGNEFHKRFGKLRPGYEWLAFTFQTQGIQKEQYQKHFESIVSFSEQKLKEAYSRMDMSNHGWTKGTPNEIDFVINWGENDSVLDLGCGQGRHSIELAMRKSSVTGVDFSEKNITAAKKNLDKLSLPNANCTFIVEDVRTYRDGKKYDKVLCLFDVIGSFPDMEDNQKIIQTAYAHLKKDGIFILSVMNMEYTQSVAHKKNVGNLNKQPDILQKLLPSNTMQSSGNIFNPDYFAIDTPSGLVYRKEQFSNDDSLSAEYVIRDKRFTRNEIISVLENEGFEILDSRYVRAGHFDEKLHAKDSHAKEICIVARKKE